MAFIKATTVLYLPPRQDPQAQAACFSPRAVPSQRPSRVLINRERLMKSKLVPTVAAS